MPLFADPLHDEFASWGLGFAPYGGADVGEIQALASDVTVGDDASFLAAFSAMALRRIDEGDVAAAAGHRHTARDCYLRAACLLGIAYHPIYGWPVDDRLTEAFHRQMDTFEKTLALFDPPAETLDIAYDGTRLSTWALRAPGYENTRRPTILVGGGWDSTVVESYLAMGAAALRRGYHVILHEGPGQGRLLIDERLPLRHDWEHVVGPVIDAAMKLNFVDTDRIVYQPWSLGGYLAPRVAAFDHRLAAVVADPGQIDVGGKFTAAMGKLGLSPEAVARLPHLDVDDEQALMKVINDNRSLHWKIVQRGFWTNNAADLSSWIAEITKWKLDAEMMADIRCPTLVTAAESDMASADAAELFDALAVPKRFLRFTNAEGAGGHCAIVNRSMANRQILDWLDDTLSVTP